MITITAKIKLPSDTPAEIVEDIRSNTKYDLDVLCSEIINAKVDVK